MMKNKRQNKFSSKGKHWKGQRLSVSSEDTKWILDEHILSIVQVACLLVNFEQIKHEQEYEQKKK